MNDFTNEEFEIIDNQGWNADSINVILAGWNPATQTRLERFQSVADVENGVFEY
jgi:hypothetical protein